MKKIWKALIAAIVIIASITVGSLNTEAKEGFEINKHVVEMEVHEDGSILVRETLDVEFLSPTLHGIYVNIPSDYDMTWKIGDQTLQKSYHFPVIHVKALSSHKKQIENFSEGVQIRFGDPDRYASHNEVYKFEYEIITRDLDLDGLQMLFMNIISKGWNTTTDKTEFFISMPKAFDSSKLYFDTPEGVTNKSQGSLNFTVTGNTVSGSYDKTLRPGEAITVQLILDNNYFRFPDFNVYNLRSLLAGGSLAVIFAILFYLFGKDDPIVETVEYHAPAGLTSAEVGVIIDGIANDGDVISLILDWGRRGRINIIDNKGSVTLEKVNDLEDTAKNFEHTVFDKLFEKKDKVKINSLTGKFYQTINQAEMELDEYFRKGDAQLYTTTSKILQVVCCILSFVPIAIATGSLFYYYYYSVGITFAVILADAVFIIAATAILIYMDQRRYFHKWTTRFLLILLVVVLAAVPCFLLMFQTGKVRASYWISLCVIIANVLAVLCAVYMKKMTENGRRLFGQVVSLRNWILNPDEERLQELCDENPYYFYDILPFAYALGLTDVWNDGFQNLTVEPCVWYRGHPYHDRYYMIHSMESQMNTIETKLTKIPESSSGGSSFSGGGGSSGGFSGGGFGGSSGGSW